MQQQIPIEDLPSGPRASVLGLDARLERGPLQVRALWSEAQTRRLPRRVRERRRRTLLVRVIAGLVCACSVAYVLSAWLR